MNEIDFQIEDNLCAKIIEDFNLFSEFEQMHAWLDLHKSLYDQINIQPKWLPSIANCNYEGIRYDHIAKFHSLYHKVDYEYHILDHKSHEEVIVYFIEQMNPFMIHQYLLEKEYMGMEFRDFIYKLNQAFEVLKGYRGNNNLSAETLYCSNCNKKQYFFIGENDESYIHLKFKVINGVVNDFIECRELKCELPFYLDSDKQVWIDTERPLF